MKLIKTLCLLALSSTFAFSAAACAAADDPSSADEPTTGGDSEDDELRATGIKVTEDDAGKTIRAEEGQSVLLMLPANGTTGYSWKVTRTSRTLGYGKYRYIGSNTGAIGAGGMARFTWKTTGPLPMKGSHEITLEYRRPWEDASTPAARTFKFTLEIVAKGQASLACVVGGCSGQLCVAAGGPGMISTCEWLPHYACFQRSTCEVQANGKCGWTESAAFKSCMTQNGR